MRRSAGEGPELKGTSHHDGLPMKVARNVSQIAPLPIRIHRACSTVTDIHFPWCKSLSVTRFLLTPFVIGACSCGLVRAGLTCGSSERTSLDTANEEATDASFVSDKKWSIKADEIHFQFTVHLVPDFHAAIMRIYTDTYKWAVRLFVYPVMCTWGHACIALNTYF